MSIKYLLRKLYAKLTGRKCSSCKYNRCGHCVHPSDGMYLRCWHSITRPSFKPRPPRYLRENTNLTQQEQHDLEKIKATLQEASDTARAGDLLGECGEG